VMRVMLKHFLMRWIRHRQKCGPENKIAVPSERKRLRRKLPAARTLPGRGGNTRSAADDGERNVSRVRQPFGRRPSERARRRCPILSELRHEGRQLVGALTPARVKAHL